MLLKESYSYIPANNGEPFCFRIGSVKSAQLFQLSAENFFRLRYESVPLAPVTRKRIQLSEPTLAQLVPKVKPNRIKIG